jgi:hypothetical protein
MVEGRKDGRNPLARVLASEILLGTLVAILSVMTAWAAYLGALSDSAEGDANVEAQKILSLSNTEFLRANQDIVQDYTMYDGYYINLDRDPELADYYEANFSDELLASLERDSGPFDDPYYDAIYAEADSTYDEAGAKFDQAQQAGERANRFQLAGLIFAVGLALAAWASIIRAESSLRPVFSIISLVTLSYGAVMFFSLL